MYVAGVVIAFATDGAETQAARDRLGCVEGLTLAECVGNTAPAVLEVAGPREAREWHEWALSQPGIRGIDVVFVHWDEPRTEERDDA